ncbi:bifunctional lysylphosphatidylglycerol flippase/synthetase MprF [Corynebacterium sp. S7]
MIELLKRIRLSLIGAVLLWVLYPLRDNLALTGSGDAEGWHLFTSGMTTDHWVPLIMVTLAVIALGGAAEVAFGSRRYLIVAFASQMISVPLGFLAAEIIENLGFNEWGEDLLNATYLSPLGWLFTTTAAATAWMPLLWKRRLRVFLIALSATMVLYAGTLVWVVAAVGVAFGVLAGEVLTGQTFTLKKPSMSIREARILVALVYTSVAVGPLLSAINPQSDGPFSLVTQLLWQPTVSGHMVHKLCTEDPNSVACFDATTINQLSGIGPTLSNLVPFILQLVIAYGLVRGRRLSWILAILTQIVTIAVISAQVVVTPSNLPAELFGVNLFFLLLPWIVCSAVLIRTYRHFYVRINTSAARNNTLIVLAAFLVTAVAWIVGASAFSHRFTPHLTFTEVLLELPRRYLPPVFNLFFPTQAVPTSHISTFIYEWVGVIFWIVALVALYRVTASAADRSSSRDRDKAHTLLKAGTGDHLSWMTLWDGNKYFFSGNGYVAYRLKNGIAVSVGEPIVGEGDTRDAIAEEFEKYVQGMGARVAWYSVREEFERPGFRQVHVAEESVLDATNVEFKGKKFQNIRTARNHAAKEGVRAEWTTWNELDFDTRERVIALSEAWVAEKALPEMGFTLGGLEELKDPDTSLLLAIDEKGAVHGVTSWLPVYKEGKIDGYTLDFMRRDAQGWRPAIEFLIAEAMIHANGEGIEWISLSGAPLMRSGEPEGLLDTLLDRAGDSIEPLYGFRSLASSKNKFHPGHTSWVLAYDDELALPAIGQAVVSCYLPTMRASDTVAVARAWLQARKDNEPKKEEPKSYSS